MEEVMCSCRNQVYLMSRSEVFLREACLAKNSGSHSCRVSDPARLEQPVGSELPSPLPLPYIYTPKSPYECVGLGLVGLSHSPQANESAGKGF